MRAMLYTVVYSFILCIHLCAARPLAEKRHAPFESVKTRLDQDYTDLQKDEPNKYFHEARFGSHYDGRFGDRKLAYEERRISLKALAQTYLSTMRDIGIETFIVQYVSHGVITRNESTIPDIGINASGTYADMRQAERYLAGTTSRERSLDIISID